jgi:hypothetical protein
MTYRYRPSKSKAKAFAIKMKEIEDFCIDNGIQSSRTNDSYYFNINGVNYRVSNHTIECSNKHAFNDLGVQTRELYHDYDLERDVIQITASKTRIIQIYNDLKAGHKLNKRGYVID